MTRLDSGETKSVRIDDLYIWTDNPRIPTVYEEKDAIALIYSVISDQKMINLMKDIVNVGLQINEAIVTVKTGDKYHVYDGNRRISAIKTLLNPELIAEETTREKIIHFKNSLTDFTLDKVEVKVVQRDVALELMVRKHGNNSDGTGLIPWTTWNRDKALVKLGRSPEYSYAFNAIVTLGYTGSNDLKSRYGIQYTDLERILSQDDTKAYFANLERTKTADEYKALLDKYLMKLSLIKKDEGKPLSRIFDKKETISEVLDTFKEELSGFQGNLKAFTPSPSRTPGICPIDGNIQSKVPVGRTLKNSTSTEDMLFASYWTKDIDIDVYSNSAYLEMKRIRKNDLNRFPISFGALIRILLETSLTDFLKKVGIKPKGSFPYDLTQAINMLDDSDFVGMERLSIKSVRDFVNTNMVDSKSNPPKLQNGPFIDNLQNLLHNAQGNVLDFRLDLNNYVIPMIIAMSNHLEAKSSSTAVAKPTSN